MVATGHPAEAFISNPRLWESLIHTADLPEVKASNQKLMAGNSQVVRNYRLQNSLTRAWSEMEDRAQLVGSVGDRPAMVCGAIFRRNTRNAASATPKSSLNDLLESVEGIVWEVDPSNLRYTYVSQQAERLLGYPMRQWMEEPTFWQDHLHPDDAAYNIEKCLSEIRGLRNHELEYRMIAADGRIVWLRDYVTVVVVDGAPLLVRGIMVDITAARQAAEALRALNEAFETAGKIAKVGMWELDLSGTPVLWWSSMTYEIHEVEQGRKITLEDAIKFYIPEHRHLIQEAVESSKEGDNPWDLKMQIETAKGRRIWVRAIGHSIWHQGKIIRLRGVFQDIDASERAEDKLRESERCWQFALEGNGDGVWDWDTTANTAFFSRQVKLMLGFTQEEMKGYFNELTDLIHPDDLSTSRSRLEDHLQNKTAVYTSEHRLRCKDGGYKWVLDRGMALNRTTDGNASRIIGTITDITARKALDERVRQAQKMDAIGQLAGGIAHDFNNILAVILMHAELALASVQVADEMMEPFIEIQKAAKRAADLTRQLLLFSRRQTVQPRISNLNELIANLVKMLQRLIGADIEIKINLCKPSLIANLDPGMIEQVVMNLVVNARDAITRNGLISIQTEELNLQPDQSPKILEAKPGRYAVLQVQDNGAGITEENIPRVFDPFFTTREPGKGTGLGLTAVFGIIKQHHGFIQVESLPNQGTTIRVHLPLSDDSTPSKIENKEADRAELDGKTILLVEDEPSLRKATQRLLGRQGIRVLEASNGPEALRVWQQHFEDVDLLLTDIVMPQGLTGLELSKILQTQKPGLRVIFCSGYSSDIAGRVIDLPSSQSFLQKPFSPALLLETIRKSLNRS